MVNQKQIISRAISTISHPVFVFPLLALVYFNGQNWNTFLIVFLLSYLLPLSYFFYLYRTKQISDLDVSVRTQRYRLYFAALVGLLGALLYLYLFSSATLFFDFGRLILVGLIIVVVNFKIKVSVHTALMTLLCLSLNQEIGIHPFIYSLIPIVAYSRLVLKRHQPIELVLGVVIPACILLLFKSEAFLG